MPRYYFDVEDSGPLHDDTGTECADLAAVRRAAMKLLPSLLNEERADGDRLVLSLVVRDGRRRPVFSVTLSLVGQWLTEDQSGRG